MNLERFDPNTSVPQPPNIGRLKDAEPIDNLEQTKPSTSGVWEADPEVAARAEAILGEPVDAVLQGWQARLEKNADRFELCLNSTVGEHIVGVRLEATDDPKASGSTTHGYRRHPEFDDVKYLDITVRLDLEHASLSDAYRGLRKAMRIQLTERQGNINNTDDALNRLDMVLGHRVDRSLTDNVETLANAIADHLQEARCLSPEHEKMTGAQAVKVPVKGTAASENSLFSLQLKRNADA